jgi:predicted Zn-dependent protease
VSTPAELARNLLGQGRAAEALAMTAPLADAPAADALLLDAHAAILKALERQIEARPYQKRATLKEPQNRIIWHNYAALLNDLGDHGEARKAVDQAMRLGLDAPETWLVSGRNYVGLEQFHRAEASYREALKRRPDYYDAHRDLAQLIWMRTGDPDAAIRPLDEAGQSLALAPVRAMVLQKIGRADEGYALLKRAAVAAPQDLRLQQALANAASEAGEFAVALPVVDRLVAAASAHPAIVETACMAWLGAGRASDALAIARARLQADPIDQIALGMAATAARITGDPEYERYYDYDAFVRPKTIDTPKGWKTTEAYLADLKATLIRLHKLKAHPFENSLRGGSQTSRDLRTYPEPTIEAFFKAIDGPIRAYMEAVGKGDDPIRSRNTGNYAIRGAWSVRLRPGGHHVDHIHPQGWLSSAFYVETPAEALDRDSREGWIKFGQPRFRTEPPLGPAHYVRPVPGTLCLFPSYMWHGTVPFTTDESRMTIAFDVVPA